ncbi:MAG: hypothetical protein QG623_538 [Patescibacteria group bacterium]|nr:hypothetical protein [Patescibacteria group bacterium]
MLVKVDWLKEKTEAILKDFSSSDQESIFNALLWAESTGKHTQGFLKLAGTEPIQSIKATSKIKIKNKKCVSRVDGGGNPSVVATERALAEAISNAKKHGVGIATLNNTFSSNATQSYYLYKAAKKDLICLMMSRSPAVQTGFGSIDPLFGTNPFGLSFPTKDEPLFFDYTTASMTFYGLILASIKGERLPADVALDKDGDPTFNPNSAIKGAMRSFDSNHKSDSLALMVETLAGPLAGAAFADTSLETSYGTFILCMDPDVFTGAKRFKSDMSEMLKRINNSRTEYGKSIRLPSTQALEKWGFTQNTGLVDVDEAVLREVDFL